nr:unnamed protein product [Digitaria exilis]
MTRRGQGCGAEVRTRRSKATKGTSQAVEEGGGEEKAPAGEASPAEERSYQHGGRFSGGGGRPS